MVRFTHRLRLEYKRHFQFDGVRSDAGVCGKRFGTSRTPPPVEWLTDNGPCFTAKETVEYASWLSLVSRFTPIRSPQSNGMDEEFVKTFKRDYVYVYDRPDVRTNLAQLAAWFWDYNEETLHKG